ncbi:MAG: hypothetical protein ACYCUV_12020, partial [Phycisphaerae bacterium]
VVSGVVSAIAPAARAAQQFITAPGQITVRFWATKHDAGYYLVSPARLRVHGGLARTLLHNWAGIPWSELK